jgi:His/Glu/Gln/Arg/opine family amino acid ABC transporter permease subunit
MDQFHLRILYPYLWQLPNAIWTSITLSGLAIAFGLLIGIAGALAKRRERGFWRWLAAAYVEVLRNTPLLILLYLVFFGLPRLGFGRIGGYGSALIAMSLNCGAYMIEVLRAGLLAIPTGQHDAASALGLSRGLAFRFVTFPQMMRAIYAPLGNIFVQVLLGSSLASVVSVDEISDWMQNTGSETFRYFESFAVAGFVYIVLCQCIGLAKIIVGAMAFPDLR